MTEHGYSLARRLSALLGLALALSACAAAEPASTPSSTPAAAPVKVDSTVPPAATLTVAAPLTTPPPTALPEPSATPAPAARQLTSGGCCVQPIWSPDGTQVWYLDRPEAASPSGWWGVDAQGGAPQFITDRLGLYSPDRSLLAFPEGGQTIIERLATGERWVAPSAGRPVSFSPNGQLIAWSVASSGVNFDRRQVEIWVASVDGLEPRRVAQLRGGGLSGWLPDSQHMLVTGRDEAAATAGQAEVQFVGVLSLADGTLRPIVSRRNLRGASLSPGAGWLLFSVAFSGDPAADGQWVVPVAGGEPLRLDTYGPTRWRSEGKLLVIPVDWESEAGLRLVEIDAATGAQRALTDPAQTALPIGGGDWALSPDGRRLVFVSAIDRNLWLLELPE